MRLHSSIGPAILWWLARHLLTVVNPRWLERRRVTSARRKYGRPSAIQGEASTRILVDLTVIARKDAGTGIQRVVRSTISEMCSHSHGWTVQPVTYERGAFRHTTWPINPDRPRSIMHAGPGDIFLGLDLSLDAIRHNARALLRLKQRGVRFWFVVYDLLPIQSPQYFSSKVTVRFTWWLSAVAKLAEGFICISSHVADDLRTTLALRLGLTDGIVIEVAPMGFNMVPNDASNGTRKVLETRADTRKILLAVGTIEPRKGYDELLDALELLWARNAEVVLVIVGAPGWKTKVLRHRIQTHPENQSRLHWFSSLDDADLAELYDDAHLLVAPSHSEGFGLPVVEAIARSCPVLARDIAAFRAHENLGVRFFPREADSRQLAAAIAEMLGNDHRSNSDVRGERLPTWLDTSNGIFEILASAVSHAAPPPGGSRPRG